MLFTFNYVGREWEGLGKGKAQILEVPVPCLEINIKQNFSDDHLLDIGGILYLV